MGRPRVAPPDMTSGGRPGGPPNRTKSPTSPALHLAGYRKQYCRIRHGGCSGRLLTRFLVPGEERIALRATLILEVVGSFVGGFLGWLIFHRDAAGDRRDHRREDRAAAVEPVQLPRPPKTT